MSTLEEIFAKRFFRPGAPMSGGHSQSGVGSHLSQTNFIRQELPIMFGEYNVRSLLDVPCGDFNWMKEVDLGEIEYIGGDIISDLIDRNRQLYSAANRRFERLDLITSKLPRADAVICRDCLVHLSNANIFSALRNICDSGAHFLVTTHYNWRAQGANFEIADGDWRRLNFELPPFCFPSPQRLIIEHSTENDHLRGDKALALWSIGQIRSRLPAK